MGYVAMKVVRISGKRYMPGEPIEVDLTESKSLHSLLAHGYVAGYPDSVLQDGKKSSGKRAKGKQQDTVTEPTGGDDGDMDLQRGSDEQSEG